MKKCIHVCFKWEELDPGRILGAACWGNVLKRSWPLLLASIKHTLVSALRARWLGSYGPLIVLACREIVITLLLRKIYGDVLHLSGCCRTMHWQCLRYWQIRVMTSHSAYSCWPQWSDFGTMLVFKSASRDLASTNWTTQLSSKSLWPWSNWTIECTASRLRAFFSFLASMIVPSGVVDPSIHFPIPATSHPFLLITLLPVGLSLCFGLKVHCLLTLSFLFYACL